MPLNFPSAKELRKHTKRHWREFNLVDENAETDYLALARVFCGDPCPVGTEECTRTCDSMIDRFCETSAEFAVMMPGRAFLLTYHILYPIGTVGALRTHEFRTNREYFQADCECMT